MKCREIQVDMGIGRDPLIRIRAVDQVYPIEAEGRLVRLIDINDTHYIFNLDKVICFKVSSVFENIGSVDEHKEVNT